MKLLNFFVGDQHVREQRRLAPFIQKIQASEPSFEELADTDFPHKTTDLKARFQAAYDQRQSEIATLLADEADPVRQSRLKQQIEQTILTELLPEGFALVREVAKRIYGMRHFDVQLLGGMILHDGKIAEMKTGEGKTLVATLPAYLNALAGHGVHVVTVNDYLARRDAQWMGKIYHQLGLTVGVIGHQQSWQYAATGNEKSEITSQNGKAETTIEPTIGQSNEDWPNLRSVSRREAYLCDITYGTNNEFGFDYLRDNMAQHPSQLVQRGLWYAIVDEVDSILIDEARTPLIISAPAEESTSLYQTFAQVTKRLKRDEDYAVDEKFRTVTLSDDGIRRVEEWIGVPNLYAPDHVALVHHLEEALKAEALFSRDKEYVVRDGEVVIVDEFTGRLMPGRRYSEGLHQAIEAKEQVAINRESDTLATISFQNLFRLYAKLSGMTGTAVTESEEFWKIYQIDVISVPTHRPLARIDHQDLIYKTESGKLSAVIQEVKRRNERGQPILIGTVSIEKNELLSRLLTKAGIKHQVLNAKQHEREAKIIANAGKVGSVTLATNMAGRGVDIILGGQPPKAASQQPAAKIKGEIQKWEAEHQNVLELGGLCVIGTERHEARRIDNQLRGRAGRQGDAGETQFYISMEDELMRIFGGERMISLMDRLGVPEDQPIQAKLISNSIESAQRRVEGHNFDMRKHLVEYDDVMNKHREYIYRQRRKILLGETEQSASDNVDMVQTSEIEVRDVKNWLHQYTLDLMDDAEQVTYLEKASRWNEELTAQIERAVWLRTIDTMWVEHLNAMEALRTGIGLRGYGQHDPLVAYRQEGYQLFERLQRGIEQEVIRLLLHVEIQNQPQPLMPLPSKQNLRFRGADDSKTAGFRSEQMSTEAERQRQSPATSEKVGRNDPCPCGSGKKYKKCHGT